MKVKRVAPFKAFLKEVLHWHLIKNKEANLLTKRLVEDIRSNNKDSDYKKFTYFKFIKYARLKRGRFVYGLCLVGWNDVAPYRVMPNLISYFEKEDSQEVDDIISDILANYDHIKNMKANKNFISDGVGFFVIPKYFYRKEYRKAETNK